MIKQIAAKKIDSIISKHLTGYGYRTILANIPPAQGLPAAIQKITNKSNLLPPLSTKPALLIEDNPNPGLDLLPEAGEGCLLMGDVVTIIALESEGVAKKPSLIFGDGIAHNNLDCVPTTSLLNSEKIQFRLCLFRIEPIRQYGYSSMLRLLRKSKEVKRENLNLLEKAEEEENLDNENEASLSYGTVLRFGDRIQLRHVHSNCFVNTSREVSKERGCLKVLLDPIGGEGSWLELKACSLIKKQGEAIKYSDSFSLIVNADNEKYFIHMGCPKSWKEDEFMELNASSSFTYWQVRKFISHFDILQNPDFVATGDSFRIMFKHNEGLLSISPRRIEEILPELEEIRSNRGKDKKDSMCTVYIEKKKTCMSLWELVRENPFFGGIAEKDSVYKIKNVATGLLLAMSRNGHVFMTSDQSTDATLFRIVQEPNSNVYHTFETIIKIESPGCRKVLMAGNTEMSQSIFFTNDDYSHIQVESTINRKQDTRTAFTLSDEPEESTIYIYQISSLLPKIISFYRFIKSWGCIKRGNSYSPNYELAKSTESELENQVDFMIKILGKLNKKLLKEDSLLEEHQESLRLTGFLELMLKFVILLDKKLELPPKLPVDVLPRSIKKSKIKIIEEGAKYLKPEMMLFPGVIGLKHFYKLSKEIYIIIYKSIKDNTDSCIELQKHQEFLSSQLNNYKDQVGVLLKELYKLSSGSIAKSNPALFQVWVDQVRCLNEKEENLDELIISFKILAFLCKNEKGGIPANQNYIADHFYNPEREYTIFKAFLMDEIKPFLGFSNDKYCNFQDFITNTPKFSSLSLEDRSKMLLYYPENFNNSREHINYVSSIFEFLTNLCLSQNEKLINKTIEFMGLNYDHLYLTISDTRVHIKLRTYYLKIIWVLYFDKSDQDVKSQCQQRCFLWDINSNLIEPDTELYEVKEDILGKVDKKPISLEKLNLWILGTWLGEDMPWTLDGQETERPKDDNFSDVPEINENKASSKPKIETIGDRVRFLIEIIKLSKKLVDYNYVNYDFVNQITPFLITLLGGVSNHGPSWVTSFKSSLIDLGNERLHLELIENIIDFFQIKFFASIDSEVKERLLAFSAPVLDLNESDRQKKGNILSKFKFKKNKEEKSAEGEGNSSRDNLKSPRDNKTRFSQDGKNSSRSFAEPDKVNTASLDTVLLNLIFNKTEDSLKDKIINLLLSNLDVDKTILKNLDDIVLIPNCELRQDYKVVFNLFRDTKRLLRDVMYMEPLIFIDGVGRENPRIAAARNSLEVNIKNFKTFISPKREVSMRKFLQKIYKNLGIHNLLLNLFLDDWPWIKKVGAKTVLQDYVCPLYIVAIKTLKNFCCNSTENQETLYEHLEKLEIFKHNTIGTKSLIAEVLKCKRNLKTSVKIIENMFISMSKKQNPMESPDNLLIIKSLIHDESLRFYASNQTAIIKSLLVTKNLYTVFSCETSWDLSKFSSKGIRFFSMMIDIIARCSIFNEYATHQARRLIPYKVLLREMKNTSMLFIKKSYLHFLFYVFFMETPNIKQGLSDQEVQEIVVGVVFNDIAKYKHFIDHLTGISIKGMYDPVTLKKQYKFQPEIKKQKTSKLNSLTREQAESLEYWKYVFSHKPDTPRISTGLICVIKDITLELRSRGAISEGISYALFKIKIELQDMLNIIFEKMLACDEVDMDFMISEIAATLFEIPYFYVNEEESLDQTEQNEAYTKLVQMCKEFIEKSYTPFEDFIAKYLAYENGIINKISFLLLLKKSLKLEIKVSEVEQIIKKFDPDLQSNEINIETLRTDIKALFIGNPYIARKERVVNEPEPIIRHEGSNEKLKEFILNIEKELEQEQNDIYLMVSNVKGELIDPALLRGDTAALLKFIQNLSKAFDKKEHKVYLINILKYILLQELEKCHESEEAMARAGNIQNIFANEEVIMICFNEFTKESSQDNTISALELLILMVKNNNSVSKQKILDYLTFNSAKIFSFLRVSLREAQEILLSPASRKGNKRRKSLSESNQIQKINNKNTRIIRLSHKILEFLQSCCNNCFSPFQEFLQIQNSQNQIVNIDLVSEICQFLLCMNGIEDLKLIHTDQHTYLSELAIQCIRCLADCCQGPCTINQILLGQRRRLYDFMNWLFNMPNPNFTMKNVWIDTYIEGILFLNALIEANTNIKIAKIFIRELELDMLSDHSGMIWHQIIKGRERIIYQDSRGTDLAILNCFKMTGKPLEAFEKDIIEIGFGINILLLTLQYLHPTQFKMKCSSILEKIDNSMGTSKNLRPGFREMLREKFGSCCNPKVQDIEKVDQSQAKEFYYSNIATVEINIRESLTKIFFRVPTMCRYFTQKSQKDLITKANRASHQEKIEDFMNKSKIYEVEMMHQQSIAKYPTFDAFISKWRIYGKVSYVTVIIINIILLTTVEHKEKQGNNWRFKSVIDSQVLLTIIGVVQIILASLVYICYLLEYLPVIKYKSKLNSKGEQYKRYLDPYFNRIKGTELMKEVLLRTSTKESEIFSHFFLTIRIILFDTESLYNLIYLLISILSWKWPLLYSILLLDLIKRNEDLKNILRSITLNSKQLLLTTLLAIIVIYIFTIISFLSFPEVYSGVIGEASAVTYCGNLFECFISNLFTGIRMGGGIGDAIVQLKDNDGNYWYVMIFNIMYFALVINILLNIIFGIIIDTFGELRDQNQAQLKDIQENCFICGNQRFLFEIKRINWTVHTKIEHNPYAYLAFMIYLRHKRIDDCSGAEKYVKERINLNETSFFPLTSLSLSALEDKNEGELEDLIEQISKIKELTQSLADIQSSDQ